MELTKSLEHRRAYEKLEEICRRAVRMDPQEETVYYRFYTADHMALVMGINALNGVYSAHPTASPSPSASVAPSATPAP